MPPRGWSAGTSRAEWLRSRGLSYRQALADRTTTAWLKKTYVEWFKTYHWSLPDNIEPPTDGIVEVSEEISPLKEEKMANKKKQIKSWFRREFDIKYKKAELKFNGSATLSLKSRRHVLAKGSKPRKPQYTHVYSRLFYKERIAKGSSAQLRQILHGESATAIASINKMTKQAWAAETDETKAVVMAEADRMHKLALGKYNAMRAEGYTPSDQDISEAIQGMGSEIDRFLSSLHHRTQLSCTLLIGGPNPLSDGKLMVTHMHRGCIPNTDPPLDFSAWGYDALKTHIVPTYAEFINLVYPQNTSSTPADPMADANEGSSSHVPASGTRSDAIMATPTPVNAPLADMDHLNLGDADARASSTGANAPNDGLPKEPVPPQIDDMHTPSSPTTNRAYNAHVGSSLSFANTGFERAVSGNPPSLSSRRPSPVQRRATSHPKIGAVDAPNADSNPGNSCTTVPQKRSHPTEDEEGDSSAPRKKSADASSGPGVAKASSRNRPKKSTTAVADLPSSSGKPEWFVTMLHSIADQHNAAWTELMDAWTQIESSNGFDTSTPKGTSVTTAGRSSWVKWWVQRHRKINLLPPIPSVDDFGVEWWQWWTKAQPSWRTERDEAGRVVGRVTGDWTKLKVGGNQGIMLFVITLYWWKRLAPQSSDRALLDQAIADVTFALTSALA